MQSRDPAVKFLRLNVRKSVKWEVLRITISYLVMAAILWMIGYVMKTTLVYEVLSLMCLLILFIASHFRVRWESRRGRILTMAIPTPVIFYILISGYRIGQPTFLVIIGLVVSWGVIIQELSH